MQRMKDVLWGLEGKRTADVLRSVDVQDMTQKQDATLTHLSRANAAKDQVPNVLIHSRSAARQVKASGCS